MGSTWNVHIVIVQVITLVFNRRVLFMVRQLFSFLSKALLVLLVSTIVLGIVLARYVLRLATGIANEFSRP